MTKKINLDSIWGVPLIFSSLLNLTNKLRRSDPTTCWSFPPAREKDSIMKKVLIALIALFVINVGCTYNKIQEQEAGKMKQPKFLIVLSSNAGIFDGKTLILKDVPHALLFSERPNRIAKHEQLSTFVEGWNKGSDSFKTDPPNATLSIYSETQNKNTVVELTDPQATGNTIRFQVKIIEGNLPKSFEGSSLFIDMELFWGSGWSFPPSFGP